MKKNKTNLFFFAKTVEIPRNINFLQQQQKQNK